jgi:hypothetical protein
MASLPRSRVSGSRASDDAGSVLVMVLVFVTVIGMLTVALLETTGATLASASVTTHNLERVSAVNAGVDVCVQAMRADAACPASVNLDGHVVSVTSADLGTAFGSRSIAIRSMSAGTSSQKQIVATAQVVITTTEPRTATVISWAVDNP